MSMNFTNTLSLLRVRCGADSQHITQRHSLRTHFRLPIDVSDVYPFSRMSKLIYITNASLDGYIEDQTGAFDWGNSDQVFDFITELLRPIGTHLLGRRLQETMAYWDGPSRATRSNTASSHGSGRRLRRSSSHGR